MNKPCAVTSKADVIACLHTLLAALEDDATLVERATVDLDAETAEIYSGSIYRRYELTGRRSVELKLTYSKGQR